MISRKRATIAVDVVPPTRTRTTVTCHADASEHPGLSRCNSALGLDAQLLQPCPVPTDRSPLGDKRACCASPAQERRGPVAARITRPVTAAMAAQVAMSTAARPFPVMG